MPAAKSPRPWRAWRRGSELRSLGREPDLGLAGYSSVGHDLPEARRRSELLRGFERLEVVPDGDIVGIVDALVDAVPAHPHSLALLVEVVVASPPPRVVLEGMADEHADHALSSLYLVSACRSDAIIAPERGTPGRSRSFSPLNARRAPAR